MKVGEVVEMSRDHVLILVCTMQVSDSLASTTKDEKVGWVTMKHKFSC